MDAPLDTAEDVYPLDIIFSCVICQETIADVYPNGSPDLNYSAALLEHPCKLWITECAHVTCSQHLEGGGVPFYRDQSQPEAPCPLCLQEKGDTHPKKIYGIYGPEPNKHDPALPVAYFDTPPAPFKQEKCSPTMSALRFQYLALVRYGVMMRSRYRKLQSHANAISAERWQVAELERTDLCTKIEELAGFKEKYMRWKKREPEIKHYLESFSSLARENTLLKDRLVQLGYEVPRTTWSLQQPNSNSQSDPPRDAIHEGEQCIATRNGHSAHARSSNATFDDQRSIHSNVHLPYSRPNLKSAATIAPASRKRPLDEMMDAAQDSPVLLQRRGTGQLMPPPPLPIHRTAYSNHYEPKNKDSERLYSSKHRLTHPQATLTDEVMQTDRFIPGGEQRQSLSEFGRENSRWDTPSRHSIQSQMDTTGRDNRQIRHNNAHHDSHYRRPGFPPNHQPASRSRARPVQQPTTANSTLHYDYGQWEPSAEHQFQYHSPRTKNEQSQVQYPQSRNVSNHFFQPQSPTQRNNVPNHFLPIKAPVRLSEQVVDVESYKMVSQPSKGRRNSTLNSLSFINEPYTTSNEPIYQTVNQRPSISSRRLSIRSLAGFSHSSRSTQPRPLFGRSGPVQNSRDEHTLAEQRFHPKLDLLGSRRRNDPAFVSGHTQRSSLSTATSPSGPLRNGVRSSRGVFTSAGVGGARRKLVR